MSKKSKSAPAKKNNKEKLCLFVEDPYVVEAKQKKLAAILDKKDKPHKAKKNKSLPKNGAIVETATPFPVVLKEKKKSKPKLVVFDKSEEIGKLVNTLKNKVEVESLNPVSISGNVPDPVKVVISDMQVNDDKVAQVFQEAAQNDLPPGPVQLPKRDQKGILAFLKNFFN